MLPEDLDGRAAIWLLKSDGGFLLRKGRAWIKERGKRNMTGNLWQDWPVYVLLSVVVFFFGYIVIKGHIQEKKDKQVKINEETDTKRS